MKYKVRMVGINLLTTGLETVRADSGREMYNSKGGSMFPRMASGYEDHEFLILCLHLPNSGITDE